MNILVTGGAGFIGSHVVDAYIEVGHDVFVIDVLDTGHLENVNPKASPIRRSMPGTSSQGKMGRSVGRCLAQGEAASSCCTAKRTRRTCGKRCALQACAS